MRAIQAVLASALLVAGLGGDLNANPSDDGVTLTNKTQTEWKVEIVKGATRSSYDLKPDQVVMGLCKDGCLLELKGADDGSYVLEGNERIAIEAGVIYYDDPASGSRTTPKKP